MNIYPKASEYLEADYAGEIKEKSSNQDYVTILFLDLSSTCTGYCIAEANISMMRASIKQAGFIKWEKDAEHGYKYSTIYKAITNTWYANVGIDYVVAEQYSINPNKRQGCLVSPELHGAVQAACFENDPPLGFDRITPQTWKKTLTGKGRVKGVKGTEEKKRIKTAVRERFPQIPEKMLNGITGRTIATPYDTYDAIGLALHYLEIELGCLVSYDVKHEEEVKQDRLGQQKSFRNFLNLLKEHTGINVTTRQIMNYFTGDLNEEELIKIIRGDMQ